MDDYVPTYQIKKKVFYTGKQDDFFKTGVDVIEHEDVEFEGTAVDAMEAYRHGELSIQQIKEVLQKKLKDEKIFGFENYEDFNRNYFKKELVAFEDFQKVRQLKYARAKYHNRLSNGYLSQPNRKIKHMHTDDNPYVS